MEINERECVVKSELEKLLQNHSLEDTISAVDEIVLNYVLGILESLGSGDVDETEDVEQFAEMMEAYLPGFAAISVSEVCEWMFDIADKLSCLCDGKIDTGSIHSLSYGKTETGKSEAHLLHKNIDSRTCHLATDSCTSTDTCHRRQQQRQNSSDIEVEVGACSVDDGSETVDSGDSEQDCESLGVLRELCPAACTAELQHCWQVSGADVEEAARLLLYRQESGTCITSRAASSLPRKKSSRYSASHPMKDETVKDSILAKYSFVDTNEDKRTYNPSLSLKEEKKLVRYRDGQVVSTKGERFSEVKRQESEEMKKTYVNLKPARKYRFH